MLFCKDTFDCISNSFHCILLKKYNLCLTEIKKRNRLEISRSIVDENLLYLKLRSPFRPLLQKVIPYSGKV